MKTRVSLVIVLASLAAISPATGSAPATTRLTVVWYENGAEPETKIVWTVRCDPTGGTHPLRSRACASLARSGPRLFRPVPPGAACRAVRGDPRLARVTGYVDGRRVRATFTRTTSCEIARWGRIAGILVS